MTLGIRQRLNFRAEDVQTWSPERRTWFLNPEENFSAQMLLFWHSGDLKASWNLHYLLFECVFVVLLCVFHQYMMFLRKKRFVACKYVKMVVNGISLSEKSLGKKNTHSCWDWSQTLVSWCMQIQFEMLLVSGDACKIVGFKI